MNQFPYNALQAAVNSVQPTLNRNPRNPSMAMERNPFTASHLRVTRRRFLRKTRLSLALFLILTLPTLILLPGFRFSSPKRTKLGEQQEVLPPPHPPHNQDHPIYFEKSLHSQSHKNVAPDHQPPQKQFDNQAVLEEDKQANALSIHSSSVQNISAVVLFHNEYPTLNHTLHTWQGLVPHISDLVFFLNGVKSGDEFRRRLPILYQPTFAAHRVITSEKNLALGLAITEMVRQAKHDNVLLLEKDWALVEHDAANVLSSSVRLLNDGAQVVRLRHRKYPGAPLHARMMHEGREESILREQSNLFCYVHHWIQNPLENYSDYFTVCPGMTQNDAVWCAKAKYCQWTNNPALFKKSWFLEQLGERFEKDYQETFRQDPRNHMLDFEYYTNWKSEVWNDRDFVVALPRGLFEHQEISEGRVMNTVWYAWNRLQKDVSDKERSYLEQAGASCEGRDVGTNEGLWRFEERYPLEFVRQYSYSKAMNRTLEEGVAEIRKETMNFRKRLEDGHGTWRNGVTDLTNLWYKISLFVLPSEPADMKMAFVTALFRTEDADDGGRGFRVDVDATAANLDILSNYSLVVYCTIGTQQAIQDTLRERYEWSDDQLKDIKFIIENLDTLLERLLTLENVERIKKLRQTEEYQVRVRNRTEMIPSEKVLALGHTKPYILDDAMRHVEGATHLIWFDAASPCLTTSRGGRSGSGDRMGPGNDAILRAEMFLHAFVTGISVRSEEDLEKALWGSGFDTGEFLKHMEKQVRGELRVVDMKTFGGSRMAVALLTGYYDVVLRDMLREGQLGTGREALSIARNNVDYNFRLFDGFNGCSKNIDGTHSCGQKEISKSYMGEGSLAGCQLYRWIGECVVR